MCPPLSVRYGTIEMTTIIVICLFLFLFYFSLTGEQRRGIVPDQGGGLCGPGRALRQVQVTDVIPFLFQGTNLLKAGFCPTAGRDKNIYIKSTMLLNMPR